MLVDTKNAIELARSSRA